MITGVQIRMARAALGLSVQELSKMANINPNTVSRIENGHNALGSTLVILENNLTKAGIEFITDNGSGVGVKIKK